MGDKEELRKAAMEELDLVSSKSRFGYFTIPPTLAVGDSQLGKQRKLDENGKVITQPRNIYSKPSQSGNTKSSYFHLEKSVFDGDLFLDPGKHQSLQNLKKSQQLGDKDIFKPLNSLHKTLLSSSYVHIGEKEEVKDPKKMRDSDGRVVVEPRNMQTSPQSKVIESLYRHPKYMQSLYGAERVQRVKDEAEGRKKMQDVAFKNTCYQRDYFSQSKDTYGLDRQISKKSLKTSNFNIMSHDSQFKVNSPCKNGSLDFIGKYPTHVADPPREITRKPEQLKREVFRHCPPNKISTPCPSISFNTNSLRKYVR